MTERNVHTVLRPEPAHIQFIGRGIRQRDPDPDPDPTENIRFDPDAPKYKHGPKGGRPQRIAKWRAANKAARKVRKRK